jgi:hypothetical protein
MPTTVPNETRSYVASATSAAAAAESVTENQSWLNRLRTSPERLIPGAPSGAVSVPSSFGSDASSASAPFPTNTRVTPDPPCPASTQRCRNVAAVGATVIASATWSGRSGVRVPSTASMVSFALSARSQIAPAMQSATSGPFGAVSGGVSKL